MSSPSSTHFSPLALILAWLWPGLGHIIRGEKRRGGLIMLGVLFMFVAGTLIGGVSCVDSKKDRLWFYAQALCGPLAFAADFANQRIVQAATDQKLRHDMTSLSHVREMGTLFVALGGLMNLVVMLDALHPAPRRFIDRRRPRPRNPDPRPRNNSSDIAGNHSRSEASA